MRVLRRADVPQRDRGDAAAATWMFRGVAATPRLRRGCSAETGARLRYPGYALSDGAPTEASILWTADRAVDVVRDLGPKSRIAVCGQSLGCAPALRLAEKHALPTVLISPFTSVPAMAKCLVPFVPRPILDLAVLDRLDNLGVSVDSPVVVVHGTEDEIVPFDQGREVAAKIGAKFVPLRGAGHNDVFVRHEDAILDEIVAAACGTVDENDAAARGPGRPGGG